MDTESFSESFIVVRESETAGNVAAVLWQKFRFYVLVENDRGEILGLYSSGEVIRLLETLADGTTLSSPLQQLIYGIPSLDYYVVNLEELRFGELQNFRGRPAREMILLRDHRPIAVVAKSEFKKFIA